MKKKIRNKDHIKNCINCSKEFKYEIPKFCSIKCGNQDKAKNNRFWEVSTQEQQNERIKTIFNKHVIKSDDINNCWNWTGQKSSSGYGYINFNYQHVEKRAHRVSWLLHNGPILNDLHVLHKCDNRLCANPNHLFLGTHQDNMADMLNKRNNKKIIKLENSDE